MSTKFSSESLKGKSHLKDLGIDGKNIKNGSKRNGLDSSESEQEPASVCCEHSN